MTVAHGLAVGITTRNRPAALAACLASLARAADLICEIIVFDDGSEPPAETSAAAGARCLRDAAAPGYIVGRNRILAAARAPFVLLLDDDTRLIDRASVAAALDVMRGDASIAAVGFAQANADGRPWPAAMQPARADYRCLVPSFIGFAHLLRRDVFLAVGGYRASFRFYGEEKEFCLRLIDAGYSVAYLPDARVAHLPDPAGRDDGRYLRYVVRNDCLNALYNDPLWRVIWVLPARLALYFRMRRGWRVADRGGLTWILRELARALPGVLRERRPVSRATLREWKRLRVSCPPLAVPEAERAG
jgi:GT2 family glycosyltransferase